MMKYKGFIGKMEIDEDEDIIYGRVINLAKDGITFGGNTVPEAREDFERAVDDYLEWAQEDGFKPETVRREMELKAGDSNVALA